MSVENRGIVFNEENRIARWGVPILVGIVALAVFVLTLASVAMPKIVVS